MQTRQGKASPGANSEEPRQCIPIPAPLGRFLR